MTEEQFIICCVYKQSNYIKNTYTPTGCQGWCQSVNASHLWRQDTSTDRHTDRQTNCNTA